MKEQQAPRDKVLWILGSSGGEMSIIRLRKQTGLKKADLDIILMKRLNHVVLNFI